VLAYAWISAGTRVVAAVTSVVLLAVVRVGAGGS